MIWFIIVAAVGHTIATLANFLWASSDEARQERIERIMAYGTSVYVLNLVLNMCLLFWALVLIFSNW